MDNRGRIYNDPTDEQITKKKLVKLSESDMEVIRELNEIQRKELYLKKIGERKKNGPYGKDYFRNKEQ